MSSATQISFTTVDLGQVTGDEIVSGDRVSFSVSIPILAWKNSGAINLINDDTVESNAKVIASGSSTVLTTVYTDIVYDTVTEGVLAGGVTYTIPSDGVYEIDARIQTTTNLVQKARAYLNGTTVLDEQEVITTPAGVIGRLHRTLRLSKGDTVKLQGITSSSTSSMGGLTFFSVTRWSEFTAGDSVGFGLADPSGAGLVSVSTQALAGRKTFDDPVRIGAGVDEVNQGKLDADGPIEFENVQMDRLTGNGTGDADCASEPAGFTSGSGICLASWTGAGVKQACSVDGGTNNLHFCLYLR